MATLRTVQWWAVAVGIVGCSVSPAGLSPDVGVDDVLPGSSGGASSSVGSGGGSGGAGGQVVAASGGASGLGGGGRPQSGGTSWSGGAIGSGGAGIGGMFGTGGTGAQPPGGGAPGTGGTASGGAASGGAASGGAASGGATPGSGGAAGAATGGRFSGGAPGSGGAGSGGAASGGAASGGRPGSGGRQGTSCSHYPDGAMPFVPPGAAAEHCYWFRAETRTWQAARAQCMSAMGADLVTIRSVEENQFVRALARFTNSPPEVWIGATDDRAGNIATGPGVYRWVVATETWGPYTNWNQVSPKQPDGYCDPCNNGQPCTCDHRGTMAADGTWYDFWQENPRGYVCEGAATAD